MKKEKKKIIETREKNEKLQKEKKKKLLKKFKENEEKIQKQKEENSKQVNDKLLGKLMKEEDISESPGRFEKQKEYKKKN